MGGVAGAALTCADLGAFGAPALAKARPEPSVVQLSASGISLITGFGGNVLVAPDGDSLVLVDSGVEDRAGELASLVSHRFGKRPVHTLFNTHWHVCHTGGNEVFAKSGAKIVAHKFTRQWMGTEVYINWQDRTYEPRAPMALPTETFTDSGEMPFGKGRIEYGHLPRAHTDGDIYVFFPEDNVVVAGGVVSAGQYPVLDYVTGGWIGELIGATETLLDMTDAKTRIIPGHGPVQTRDNLQAEHDMLVTVLERIDGMRSKGKSVEEMLAAGVTKEFDAAWGDPTLFVTNVYLGIFGHLGDMFGLTRALKARKSGAAK